jgi:hypothetical protein
MHVNAVWQHSTGMTIDMLGVLGYTCKAAMSLSFLMAGSLLGKVTPMIAQQS